MRKIYSGIRWQELGKNVVTVRLPDYKRSYELKPVGKHSQTGFEWGYGGSGPAELAYCILLDYLGDKNAVQGLYQAFKWKYVANFKKTHWYITSETIEVWLKIQRKDKFDGKEENHTPQ